MARYVFVLLVPFVLVSTALADALEPWQRVCDFPCFQGIATRLAGRVDLFEETWRKYPRARFYGGSSRDWAWFVRKQLSPCQDRACIERVEKELLARWIDMKEFVVGESDVDVVEEQAEINVDFDKSHFARIETIRPSWLTPGSPEYLQEAWQGGLPIEKILLGIDGFEKHPVPEFQRGLEEVWKGVPTLRYDPRIEQTKLFQDGGNHPLLLALRYLRQVGVAYHQRFGSGIVQEQLLDHLLDPNSVQAADAILRRIEASPTLDRFFANPDFVKRLNRQLKRIFRSYTNPNAARALFQRFRVDEVLERFEGKGIEPYHTVLYSRLRDPETVRLGRLARPDLARRLMSMREWAAKQAIPLEATETGEAFLLFHGTRSLAAYRSIVFQGILPSPGGSAGEGPYAVDVRSLQFAEDWSRGSADAVAIGSPLVVKIRVRPDAMILDLSDTNISGPGVSAAAEAVGADVVRYNYGATNAYVVWNGSAIERSEGHSIRVMALPVARTFFAANAHDVEKLRTQVALDPYLAKKLAYLLPDYSPEDLFEHFGEYIGNPLDVVMEMIRRLGEEPEKFDHGKRERVLERFLWRPMRAGSFGNPQKSHFYHDFLKAIEAATPLMERRVFRQMKASGCLEKTAGFRSLASVVGLVIPHASFEPNWAARYAHALLQDRVAYEEEVRALATSWNPVLALSFQGIAEFEARRRGWRLPPVIPVTVTAEDWLTLGALKVDGNGVLTPAVALVAEHGDLHSDWVDALEAATIAIAERSDLAELKHHFAWDVADGFGRPFSRDGWNRSHWRLFTRLAPWLDQSLELWRRPEWPVEFPIPATAPDEPAAIERFFARLGDRFRQYDDRKSMVFKMVEAWLPAGRRREVRERLEKACAAALGAP